MYVQFWLRSLSYRPIQIQPLLCRPERRKSTENTHFLIPFQTLHGEAIAYHSVNSFSTFGSKSKVLFPKKRKMN